MIDFFKYFNRIAGIKQGQRVYSLSMLSVGKVYIKYDKIYPK